MTGSPFPPPEFEEIRDYVREHGCHIIDTGRFTDYHFLCRSATDHAGETGHSVAVSCTQQAVYGPYTREPSS